MKKFFLGLLILNLLFSVTSYGQVQNKNEGLWKQLQETRNQMKSMLEYRQDVERSAYFFTKSLCYIYEYRKKNNLPLVRLNPDLEDAYIARDYFFNPDLQDAVISWTSLFAKGAASNVDFSSPDNSFIISRSHYSQTVVLTQGYIRAIKECSDRLNIQPSKVLEQISSDIKTADLNGSVGVNLIGFGGVGFLAKLGIKKAAKTIVGRYVAKAFSYKSFKWAVRGLIAGIIGYAGYEYFKVQDESSQLTNSISSSLANGDTSTILGDSSGIDMWAQRKLRLFQFAVHYKDFFPNELKESDIPTIINKVKTDVKMREDLIFFKSMSTDIAQKKSELDTKLSQDSDLQNHLMSILDKQNKNILLLPEEAQLLQDAQLYGSIEMVEKVSAIYFAPN